MSDLRKKSIKNDVGLKRTKKEEFVLTISKERFEQLCKKAKIVLATSVVTILATNTLNNQLMFGKYHSGAIGTYYNKDTVYAVNNGKDHAYHERELYETFLNQFKTNIKNKEDLDFEVYNFYYEIQDDAPGRTGEALKHASINMANLKEDLRNNGVNEYEIDRIEKMLVGLNLSKSPINEYYSRCDCKDFEDFANYVTKETVKRIKEGEIEANYVKGNDANKNAQVR